MKRNMDSALHIGAKKLADNFLKSEEGIKWKEDLDKELKDYILYGKSTKHLDEQLINEIINFKNEL